MRLVVGSLAELRVVRSLLLVTKFVTMSINKRIATDERVWIVLLLGLEKQRLERVVS